jgi:hypothetical protein
VSDLVRFEIREATAQRAGQAVETLRQIPALPGGAETGSLSLQAMDYDENVRTNAI